MNFNMEQIELSTDYGVSRPLTESPTELLGQRRRTFTIQLSIKQFPWDEPLLMRSRDVEADTLEEAIEGYLLAEQFAEQE